MDVVWGAQCAPTVSAAYLCSCDLVLLHKAVFTRVLCVALWRASRPQDVLTSGAVGQASTKGGATVSRGQAMTIFSGNPYLYEVDGPQRATRSHPERGPEYGNVAARDGWPTIEGASSLWEMFHNSVQQYPDNPCLGHRPIEYGQPGMYKWQTYREIGETVDAIAGGIMQLGHKAHGRIGVYGINSPEWMIAMQACNRQTAYCVPLYDTLGPDAVEYIIGHAEVTIVFASALKMRALVEPLSRAKGKVKAVIVWGEMDGIAKMDMQEKAGLEVYTWADFIELGRKHPAEPIPPKPQDLCTIMYTSGTTGNPKMAAINQVAGRYGEKFNQDDVMISYLPLAHIFDRALEEMFLAKGARIGYWRGSIEGVAEDLQALRPTLFIGVPRVFDKLYDGVYAKLALARPLQRLLFHLAFWWKQRQIRAGYKWDKAAPLADAVVFAKVKARLGGRVRLVASGSAPLAGHVEEFLKTVMCAPVAQGYGLTETCGSSFIALPEAEFTGSVGAPLPLLTFRLEAVPEMGYNPLADPPRGEIIIKGPVVFQGYFKEQGKTDEVLDKDGWFHTGDIGELLPFGSLKIIDRKKALFKLSQGEYVAPERIEGTIKKASVVQQVFVHGNSFESCVVAVVVPDEKILRAALGDNSGSSLNSPQAKEVVLNALQAAGKGAGLKSFEIPKAVHLSAEEWTPENGMLTPTFKIKREVLKKQFQAELEALYQQLKKKGSGKKPAANTIDVHSRTT